MCCWSQVYRRWHVAQQSLPAVASCKGTSVEHIARHVSRLVSAGLPYRWPSVGVSDESQAAVLEALSAPSSQASGVAICPVVGFTSPVPPVRIRYKLPEVPVSRAFTISVTGGPVCRSAGPPLQVEPRVFIKLHWPLYSASALSASLPGVKLMHIQLVLAHISNFICSESIPTL